MNTETDEYPLNAWLEKAVDDFNFCEKDIVTLRHVTSIIRNSQQVIFFGQRLFHCLISSDQSNDRSTDSVHISVTEYDKTPVNFDLELQGISGFDILFVAIANDVLLGQIFTESWGKGTLVDSILFDLKDGSTRDIDIKKKVGACYGTESGLFICVQDDWPSIADVYCANTSQNTVCQLCSMREWPAIILPDPRDHSLFLMIVSNDPEAFKYGSEGYIIQYNIEKQSAEKQLADQVFSSECLKYANNGDHFIAYRRFPAQFVVYNTETFGLINKVELLNYCPFLELPFSLPDVIGILQDANVLQGIPAGALALRTHALEGLALKDQCCFMVIPFLSKCVSRIALVYVNMTLTNPIVRLYNLTEEEKEPDRNFP